MNSQTSWMQSLARGFWHSLAPSVARTSFRAEMVGPQTGQKKTAGARSIS